MSRLDTFTATAEFVVEECCNCHVQFALTRDFFDQRQKDGNNFYCPNGHGQHYTESEEKRLKRQLENKRLAVEFWRNQANIARLSLRATKGQVTKLKKKVAAGQCPP
jgi:hypothetical protein